ncbi:hypothetical protein ACFPM7_02675 [Actinokineospora guangxiensis]|uniref:Uncharacterized protein n=1 Tax=Actinokineospora guangxiensis TaxID=1490288 RepID=A0ABW0EI09_9PSEU
MTTGPHDNEPLPSAPPVRPQQTARPAAARPKTVSIAFWLCIAVAAVLALSVLGGLSLDRATVESALREADTGLSGAELEAAAGLFITLAVALPLVFLIAFLAGAFPMRAGRNWARVLLTVFGGLLLVLTLLGTAGASPIVAIALIALIGAAIVLMYVGDSGAYFRSR